jgi:hypothetical protein
MTMLCAFVVVVVVVDAMVGHSSPPMGTFVVPAAATLIIRECRHRRAWRDHLESHRRLGTRCEDPNGEPRYWGVPPPD